MKNLRTSLITVLALAIMVVGFSINVMADETTELSSLMVYAVDDTGAKTEVPMTFDNGTFEYDITVMSNVTDIEIEAEVADSTSTWVVDKDGINTKMDVGRNYTAVIVTAADGATAKYEINTTRLTAEEEATYEAPENSEPVDNDTTSEDLEGEDVVKIGKRKYTIASTISESEIPEGFVEDVATYNDKEYPCIKGEKKDLTAFYLFNKKTSGFFIYDGTDLYKMNNIEVKSRMYTVVNPTETEEFLNNYEYKKVNIIDQEVKAWVLDAEEGVYLVYAMNWDGETDLYSYDDKEKCFQRYLVSNNSESQLQAANVAYENKIHEYNNLVERYNLLIKIICGLAVIIVILIFVIINIKLNKKAKKIKNKEDDISTEDGIEEKVKKGVFAGKISDRPYGDEITFGTENEEDEGFYGGEIEEEDDIFIDITDEEDIENEENHTDSIEEDTEDDAELEEIQIEEVEENLKETLKAMLPEESEEEVDDEDFEFIDLD